MVTDAQWCDLDKDGRKDLVLCGEFMPVMVFMNTATGFTDKTSQYFEKSPAGFWFTLAVADINGDGNDDIIAGNLGQNSQIKVSEKEPGELYYADFDHNGSVDPFFSFYIDGKSYPYVSRDELNNQVYAMRRKFSSYQDYANATIHDIFTKEELESAGKLKVTDLHTTCFLQRNGKFEKMELPLEAQFSAVTKILPGDFNNDGNIDLVLLGNRSDNRLKIGSIESNFGCLMAGDGKGNFTYISQPQSGLCIKGDVKAALEIVINDKKYIAAGICNGPLQLYKF